MTRKKPQPQKMLETKKFKEYLLRNFARGHIPDYDNLLLVPPGFRLEKVDDSKIKARKAKERKEIAEAIERRRKK